MEYFCIKRKYRDYWVSSGEHFISETPGVADVFERDRFLAIWSFLHSMDEEDPTVNKADPLYKNRALMDKLIVAFKRYYVPSEYLSLDEGMIPAKNRLGIKQYIKNKPVKWGLKSFLLCDSENGYVFHFEVYTGKEVHVIPHLKATGNVVYRLLTDAGLHDKGYVLVMDRFYTSVTLANFLHQVCGTHALGTTMTNKRFFPKQLIKGKKGFPQRGDFEFKCWYDITCYAWQDKNTVYLIDTKFSPSEVTTCERTMKDGSSVVVPTPKAMSMYNQHMGGCDNNDQMTRLNRARRHYKWPRRLFVKNVMWAIYNSYVINCKLTGKKPTFMNYLHDLCYAMIGSFRSLHSRKRRLSADSDRRLQNVGLHFPAIGEDGYNHRCIVCTKKESDFKRSNPGVENPYKRQKTNAKCTECDAFLCLKKGSTCWQDWHLKKEYWR